MLEHAIAPCSAFLIVPLFGFANAGVRLAGLGVEPLLAPLPPGIAAGLFLGKENGIFGCVWLCKRCRLAGKISGATWPQIYGIALLCGIGFTLSILHGRLALPGHPDMGEEAKN